MLKKLLIGIVIVACLGGVAVAGLAWKLDAIVQSQKPLIESTASSALGTPVSLGAISVKLLPVTRLEVTNSVVGRTPESQGITVANLVMEVDPFPLLNKQLIIKDLVITEPQLTVRRTEAGITIDGLSAKETSNQEVKDTSPLSVSSNEDNTNAGESLDITLEQCTLKDASVDLHGLTKDPLTLSKINLTSSLALSQGAISLPATTFSAILPGDLPLKGSMTNLAFDSTKQLLSFPDVTIRPGASRIGMNGSLITTNASGDITNTNTTISLESIAPLLGIFVPTLKDMTLDGDVTLSGTTTVRENTEPKIKQELSLKDVGVALNELALSSLNGKVKLDATASNQQLQSDNLSLNFNSLPISSDLLLKNSAELADITVSKLSVFSGNIKTHATLNHNPDKSFQSDVQVSQLNLAEMFKYLQQNLPLEGTLTSLNAKANGRLTGDLISSLSSNGEFRMNDALLKGINLPAAVLQQVKGLPFIEGSLLGQVPPSERAALERPDTAISSMSAAYSLANKVMSLRNLKVSGEFFEIIGDGSSTVSGEVDFKTEIMFTPGLSAALTSKIKELKYLLDDSGSLRFPLMIKGKAPKLSVFPQLDKLLKNAAKEAIKDKAGQVLDKLIGGSDSSRGAGRDVLKGLSGAFGF
jgi:hypothetical protein